MSTGGLYLFHDKNWRREYYENIELSSRKIKSDLDNILLTSYIICIKPTFHSSKGGKFQMNNIIQIV